MARTVLSALGLAVLLWLPAPGRADDVPADVRALYDQAVVEMGKGDAKRAHSTLNKARTKNPDSVDFWDLYVRVWRALEKPEDVLWTRIIAKHETDMPRSPAFALLRARLAGTPEERLGHLNAAIERAPDALEPRLLLAHAHVAAGDDELAEEVLDAILAKDPGNERALVTKGELMIASGFSRSAAEYAEETLKAHDLPGLHDLAARALLLVAENDAAVVEKAITHARGAVSGRADPAYVLTLAGLLDRTGKTAEAVTLLADHEGKSGATELSAALGRIAFRTGDYENAARGLGKAAATDAASARGLALAHARRGAAGPAREALALLVAHDKTAHAFAARVELLLDDPAAARKRLEGATGDVALARLEAAAWAGDVAGAGQNLGAAADGTREGEEALLQLAIARVMAKLGPKAAPTRKALRAARHDAAKRGVAGAALPEFEPSTAAQSFGFMQRWVTYRRSLCGGWFAPQGMSPIAGSKVDGEPAIGTGVVASAECPEDAQRVFPFNAQKMSGGSITITMDPKEEVWTAASDAFTAGAAAFVAGDLAKADASFAAALEKEPSWARASLFRAAAIALQGADLPGAAALAKTAAESLPDDFAGRELAVLIRALAAEDVKAEVAALGERAESYAPRKVEGL
jgi:tetratricopeptide (TPR) repeat protein